MPFLPCLGDTCGRQSSLTDLVILPLGELSFLSQWKRSLWIHDEVHVQEVVTVYNSRKITNQLILLNPLKHLDSLSLENKKSKRCELGKDNVPWLLGTQWKPRAKERRQLLDSESALWLPASILWRPHLYSNKELISSENLNEFASTALLNTSTRVRSSSDLESGLEQGTWLSPEF